MDSPQRELNPPTSELQESPFYKYLCTLSPIKTTKYLHVPQTYSEMTFPPPPTVFVSPCVSAHKGLSLLRRDSVSETALPAEIDIEPELPPKVHHRCSFVADYGDQHMNIGSVKLEDKGSCFELAPKIHFGAEQIEQYPSEHSQCALYGAELELNAKPSQGNSDQFCDSYEDGSKQNIFEKTSTKDSAENKKSMMDNLNVLAKKKFESMGQKENPLSLSENSEGSMSRDNELNNLEDLVLHDVENLAHKQSTFTVSVTNCNGASADFEGQSTVLVTLSSQDQKSVDFLENAAKGLDIHGAARSITNEIPLHAVHFRDGELPSQIGTCIRASGVCSRGFRRRCLDFEISEALGEKVPISADNVEQTSEVGSDISIISPSSLCKRAAATSDAINTEDSNTDCLINYFSFVENHQTDGVVASMEPDTSKSIKQGAVIPIKDKVAGQNHQNPGSSCCSLIVPSGIGLHLNSLPTNIRTLMVSNENSPLSRCTYTPVVKKVSPGSHKVHPYCTGEEATVGLFASSGPSLVISLVEKTKTNQRATMTSSNSHLGVISSSTHFQSLILEQPQDEDVRKEKPSSSFEKMLQQDMSHIYVSEVGEASSQSPHSPKKRSSGSKDKVSEGCRHCKCKKSRCLKLYCECFAAGVYCIDSCTCHECFNKPEFEETVLETRQQIESRNPLAFAPKILRAAESSPADGEDLTSTPASGRHKRGCNCKRSMCLKKYCECYQAGVGCSEGCRCEGCKNIFGRKEGGEENEENEFQFNLADKDPIIGRLEIKPECSDQKSDCKSNKNISPITPSFPLGWEGKSSVKPRLRKRRITDQGGSPLCLPPAPNSCKPSKLLMPPCNLRKFSQQDIPQTSSNLKIPGSPSSKITTPNMNEFSPGWDGLADICTLTPLPQRPSRPLPASTFILDSTVVTMPLDERDKVQPLQSLALTIASTMSVAPLQSTREKKRMHEISPAGCGEDLVDERLPNNIDETSMSFRTKTTRSSPKQKRVTPPHYEVSTNKPGTASSPSHRSPGLRKFILHALSPEKQQSHPGV